MCIIYNKNISSTWKCLCRQLLLPAHIATVHQFLTVRAYQETRAVGVGAPIEDRTQKEVPGQERVGLVLPSSSGGNREAIRGWMSWGASTLLKVKVPVLVEQIESLKEVLKKLAHQTMDIWGVLELVKGGWVLTWDALT
ncbi:hypothetical protein F5876DRAFT_71153 [Lentinula aff. lateritia]|uniref:Uncharacterized protein n=1 Tax=Lentinula aff. lateritia TaxID=2804960 RepID=A0ACC1TGT2_9AGAR|nr:hypothetical protein F5876DRAFT_71153 [Lentinula aff. lateritia]